jgi:acyl carrier protein
LESAEILTRLTPIFRSVFEDPSMTPTEAMSARDVLNWDSLNHVTLIMEVERAFGIKFALGELQDLKNVGALVALIRRKAG